MTLKKVDTIQTKYSQQDLCFAIISAWKTLFGKYPIKASVGVIIAQSGIETGGGTYCWNNNFGNVKAKDIPGQVIEYCALRGVWEIINGKKVMIPETNPGAWFRSFPTLSDGVKFHLALLKTGRYASSWAAIETGDVAMFATLLKQKGYYTAPVQDYINGMNRYFLPYMKSLDYEKALSQIKPAPPLEPWVYVDDAPLPPLEELVILPEPDPEPPTPFVIDNEDLFDKMRKVFNSVLQWLKLNL